MRSRWRQILLALAIVAALGSARAADAERTHDGKALTKHLEIRFRTGSRAAASADRWAADGERLMLRILRALGTEGDTAAPAARFQLFLYDSVPELSALTGTTGNAGFSFGRASYVPYDNLQTAEHELVHVVAGAWPKTGDETRNLFLAEGLANAVLTYVDDVHVHAVAKFYRDRKALPPLAEMTGAADFYAWLRAHPGFGAYDVAGSYVRFLLDEFGAQKVRAYYTGTAPKKAFGKTEKQIETAWLAALAAFEVRPSVQTLLSRRNGAGGEFSHFETDPEKRLPADIRGDPDDWKSLLDAQLTSAEKGVWTRADDALVAASDGGVWNAATFGRKKFKDCAIQMRVALSKCGAVQLRLGEGCQAMLVANGTFVWRNAAPTASNGEYRNPQNGEVHLTLVRRGGTLTIFVNGDKAASGAVDASAQLPGVALNGGSVRVLELKIRKL